MEENLSILDSITESAAVIDSQGSILFVNRAWKLFSQANNGNEEETNIGVNYLSVCDGVVGNECSLTTEASSGIRQVIARERDMFELEYPCHSPSEHRWFILRASKHLTDSNLTLIIHVDITNRKLSEIEAIRNKDTIQIINKRLHSSVYKIVHDIQGPLSSIIGLINISKQESDIDSLKVHLNLINRSSTNLNSFITETLQYITTSAAYAYVDFEKLLHKEIESLEPLLTAQSIKVKIDLEENTVFYTNPVEFRSVFANILTNAIKYCDQEESEKIINIFFRVKKNKVVLKIKDNGIGIAKEDILKLFEPNFQVNKEASAGVGLGLFMVKQSVDLLEGTISVTSDLNIETEFTVEIPNNKSEAFQHLSESGEEA